MSVDVDTMTGVGLDAVLDHAQVVVDPRQLTSGCNLLKTEGLLIVAEGTIYRPA